MLSRRYRASKNDIEKAIKMGFTENSDILYAKISKNEADKLSFAIIVSKKVEKTSVGRHLIKRRISAAIESMIPKIKPDFKRTVVFFAKGQGKIPKYSEIVIGVEAIMSKFY